MASGSGSGLSSSSSSAAVLAAAAAATAADVLGQQDVQYDAPVPEGDDAGILAATVEQLLNDTDVEEDHQFSSEDIEAYVSSFQAELRIIPGPAQPAENIDDLLSMNAFYVTMTPDEVDQAMAELEDINIRNTGRFVLRVLNDLLSARRWLDVIQYLEKTVRRHAHQTVVPAPANASPQDFVNIHGELFLYLHRQYVWELLANGNRVAAEQHFMEHVRPLAEYVPPGSRLRGLFNNLRANIIYDIRPRDLNRAAQTTCTEVTDYMFLYFPTFRPRREGERSPLWAFGEQITAANGTKGFRCYSCHRVYNNVKPIRLSLHLLGGNHHQGNAPCPAVQLCTLQRLALIPYSHQQLAQAAVAAAAQQVQDAAAGGAAAAGQEAQQVPPPQEAVADAGQEQDADQVQEG